jgi:hypothetical protein
MGQGPAQAGGLRLCCDCGANTAPAENRRGRWEHFIVHDDVWAAAGMAHDGGYLCVGCIEARLGRVLRADDVGLSDE